MATVKISSEEARTVRGVSNWKKLKAMKEKDIVTSALLDPDARLLESYDLARLRRYHNDLKQK